MRRGIFIGAFNPIHNTHVLCARKLIDLDYIDELTFVPCGNKYDKKSLASENERLEMIKLVLNDKMDVSSYEFGRLTYTYQTLDYLKDLYKDELYLIIGSDNLGWFKNWVNASYMLTNYKIIVMIRDGEDISNTLLDYEKYIDNIIIADLKTDFLSSTLVRDLVKKKDFSLLSNYLNRRVLDYITVNKLYEV